MSVHQLAQQLARLSDSLKQANSLITRLAKLSFQPGSEPLDSEATVRLELAQDIQDSLKQIEEDLELVQQDVEYLDAGSAPHQRRGSARDGEKDRVIAQVSRLEEDLKRSRGHFRRAQLTAKRAAEAAKQQERELVLAQIQSTPQPDDDDASSPQAAGSHRDQLFAGRRKLRPNKLTKDEALVAASSDVTAALRRTHNLLSTELSRSRFAQETLEQSSAALAELGERYTDLDDVLSKSRTLLSTLLRSQKSDTWYLETAFYILLATLCWLVFRRILYGPFIKLPLFFWRTIWFALRWIVWKPLFLFLSVTGVIRSERISAAGRHHTASVDTSRAPLIIQPSASSGARVLNMAEQEVLRGAGVPAGAGGAGAKTPPEGVLKGQYSEQVGQMADDSAKQAQGGHDNEPVRRGDGTILPDRGAEPPNPKKKTFEADVEDAKQQRRKRDEL